MNTSSLRRPLGCLKTTLRQTRQNRITFARSMATTVDAPPPSSSTPPPPPPSSSTPTSDHPRRSNKPPGISYHRHFALPQPLPTVRKTHPDPLPALTEKSIAALDPTGARARLFDRTRPDSAKVGDVLLVTTRHGEPFAGACLSIRHRGVDTAILLRGRLMNVGVEQWHKIFSPSVIGIDIVWRRPKRARRARLTYMRKPKHDMGSVAHLVANWKKERMSMRNKGGRGVKGAPIGTRF